jgi:hypothetical protein
VFRACDVFFVDLVVEDPVGHDVYEDLIAFGTVVLDSASTTQDFIISMGSYYQETF